MSPELAARSQSQFREHTQTSKSSRDDGALVPFDDGRCHLRQCRLHAASRKLARSPRRWRAPDPADDVGPGFWGKDRLERIAECRRGVSYRAPRQGLFGVLDFAGCDLSMRRKPLTRCPERALAEAFAKGGWQKVAPLSQIGRIPRSVAGFADRDGATRHQLLTCGERGRGLLPVGAGR